MPSLLHRSIELAHDVHAPIDTVWRVLTDIRATSTALTGVVEVIPLTPEPFAVGYRWVETRTRMGARVSDLRRVIAVSAPASVTVETVRLGVRYRAEFFLSRINETDTRVRVTLSGTPLEARRSQRVRWQFFGGVGMQMSAHTLRRDLRDIGGAAEAAGRGAATSRQEVNHGF